MEPRRCPECGREQATAATCPACLLERGLELADEAADRAPRLDDGSAPQTIGPYRVLRRLGEGGMGVVYLAEETEPVRRHIAIKVVKRGMDTRAVLDRFEAETQALARMDHPTIARVFQAGESDEGLPYFVMEYVDGTPINVFCQTEGLSLRERLELLGRVCAGVQHAHRKGVIHRDLKPSNVLVTRVDGKAVPKIIDFGVARAIEQHLTERSLFTELGTIVGTPEYMSPEQTELTGERVDTRTDVYALGVLQYELITGVLPFASEELRAGGFDQICRRIREVEPPRPSTRIARGQPGGISARRAGELDWVTMKALAKDPERRYGSPQELADDLARYLRDEPVLAGPPSATYRAGKFVRRNRLVVGSVAAVLLALIAGVVASTTFALREAKQRRLAEAALDDLATVVAFQSRMISGIDPREAGATLLGELNGVAPDLGRVQATDAALLMIDELLLARAAAVLDDEFADRPSIEARLRRTIATAYRELGLRQRALPHAERALELLRREAGARDPATIAAAGELGFLYQRLGRRAEAAGILRAALSDAREVLGEDDVETLSIVNDLGVLYWDSGELERAEPLLEQAHAARRRLLGPFHGDTLTSQANLGLLYWKQQRFDRAETTLREAIEGMRRPGLPEDRGLWMTVRDLGIVEQQLGRFGEAERLYREALQAQARELGSTHQDTLTTQLNLATLLDDLGHDAEAEALYRRTLELQEQALGPDHADTCTSRVNLGAFLLQRERLAEAESVTREAIARVVPQFGADDPLALVARANLAETLGKLGRGDEALELYGELIDTLQREPGPDHELTLQVQAGRAGTLAALGRPEEADALFRRIADRPAAVAGVKLAYARFLLDRDPEAALRYASAANEMTSFEMPAMLETLVEVYRALGREDDVRDTCERALQRLPTEHPARQRFEQFAR